MKKILLCVIALAFTACHPQPQPLAPPPAVPATFFAMTIVGPPDYPTVTVASLGHPSTLAWGFIEKQPGVYNFKGYDTYISAAVDHGLVDRNNVAQVTVTFGYTPPWCAADTSKCQPVGGVNVCPSPPARMSDWTNFVKAVVEHYNGTTQPHILYYELWNEFSSKTFWTGTNQQMVEMAAAAYPIIHADPYSQLLTPDVSGPAGATAANGLPDGLTWMTDYLRAGGSQYADGGSFHGYVARYGGQNITVYPWPEQDSTSGCSYGLDCFGSIVTKVTGFRQVFDQNGLRGKPMIDTEGSWGKNQNLTDPASQAAWIARWYILQASYYPEITQAAWFGWNMDGGALSPQAQVAYNQVLQWLIGSAFAAPCSSDSHSTWTCPIMLNAPALIVWNTAGNFTYTPESKYIRSQDTTGTMRRLSGQPITIGALPLLLETK